MGVQQPLRHSELDALRAAACALVLLAHACSYTTAPGLSSIGPFMAELALGLFIFVSGCALGTAHPCLATGRDVAAFLFSRVTRIVPMYWTAVLVFLITFGFMHVWHSLIPQPTWVDVVVHVSGTQVLLSPLVMPWFTLWFVGCILIYYVDYAVIARCGRTTTQVAAWGMLVVVVHAAIRVLLGVTEYRFFFYYPLFLAGILVGHLWGSVLRVLARTPVVLGCLGVCLVSALALYPSKGTLHDFGDRPATDAFAREAQCIAFILSGVGVALWAAHVWATRGTFGKHVVLFVAEGSYGAYLLHRPCLGLVAFALSHVAGVPEYLRALVVFGAAIPIVLLVGRTVQRALDRAVRCVAHRRRPSGELPAVEACTGKGRRL